MTNEVLCIHGKSQQIDVSGLMESNDFTCKTAFLIVVILLVAGCCYFDLKSR